MKYGLLAFFLGVSLSVQASELQPIDGYLVNYYRSAFPTAVLKSTHPIADPITEGNVNTTYLKLYDSGRQFLGYVREVSTTTGCDQFCKPLDFTLTFAADRSFFKLLVQEPLTKLGHREFTDSDYAKLDSILKVHPVSFQSPSHPLELIDASTRATKPEFKNDVVPTAALTSFRVYQYEKQTIQTLVTETMKNLKDNSAPVPAPAFALPDLNGGEVTFDYVLESSPFKGKVSVVLFFASWCSDCKKELPYFEKLFEKYSENGAVRFAGIRTWRNRESEDIRQFVDRMGLKFQILSDTPKEEPPYSKVAKLYKIEWVPTLFIIDKKGNIRHTPQETDFEKYVEKISALIDPLTQE